MNKTIFTLGGADPSINLFGTYQHTYPISTFVACIVKCRDPKCVSFKTSMHSYTLSLWSLREVRRYSVPMHCNGDIPHVCGQAKGNFATVVVADLN